MQILFVSQQFPYPVRSGTSIRNCLIIDALASAGSVTLLAPHGDSSLAPNHVTVVEGLRSPVIHDFATWRWVISRSPAAVVAREGRTLREHVEQQVVSNPPALVWCHRIETYHAIRDVVSRARTVVDADDVEALKVRQAFVGPSRARGLPRRAFLAADARRWRRLTRSVVRELGPGRVVVSNPADPDRIGLPLGVVRNAVPLATPGTDRVSPFRRILFHGLLSYGPNADAAAYLVDEIVPKFAGEPDVEFALVGKLSEQQRTDWTRPGVRVTGFVEDLSAELSSADCVMVPLRRGGGTRLKVIEAVQEGLPVISTAIGCDGLGLVPGEHYLSAERPQDFYSAWRRLNNESGLATSLTRAARAHMLSRNSTAQLTQDVARAVALVRS